jgi:hypothetical protein
VQFKETSLTAQRARLYKIGGMGSVRGLNAMVATEGFFLGAL